MVATLRSWLNAFYTIPKPEELEHADRVTRWLVGFAFVHNRRFGSLFVLGLMLQILFRQMLHIG